MKAAVIGLGIGMAHVSGYLKHPEAELVAVADKWAPRRAKVGGTFEQGAMGVLRPLFLPPFFQENFLENTWEEIGVRVYEDASEIARDPEIELVSLCTPDDTHEELAIMLLEAGKHLILEKPLALTLDGARRVEKAAKTAGKRLLVGYEFRVNPAVQKLKDLVDQGSLGRIRAFTLYHFRQAFRRNKWENWIQQKSRSGGLIVEETCHWFDLLRYLTGSEVESLVCHGVDDIYQDFDFEDLAFIQGRMIDGGIFQISHSLTGHDFSLVIQLHGTKGTAWCGLKEEEYSSLDGGSASFSGIVSFGSPGSLPEQAQVQTWGEEATEPFNIEECVKISVDAIHANKPGPAQWIDGYKSLEISLAARESFENRSTEKIIQHEIRSSPAGLGGVVTSGKNGQFNT